MLEGLSIPFALKICAAAVVVGGAGVATVDVVTSDSAEKTVIADSPETLGFADDAVDAEPALTIEKQEPSAKSQEEDKPEVEKTEVEDKEDHGVDDAPAKDDKVDSEKEETEESVKVDVSILFPEHDSHHEKANVVFEGEVSAGAQVFAGPYEATVDDDGHWRIELVLSPGANKATIKAVDSNGNIAEDSITAWLDVEEKEVEKKEEPSTVEFSANQKYGSCEEPTPYDVFWGTAKPNSVVQIASPYGSATVEVGKKGHWEKKVFFETAPRGQAFAVTVTAENGSKTFEFLAKVIEEPEPKEEK